MSILSFQDFSVGKDLRKGKSVADANRLRELKNGYVTAGKAVRKRPGTVLYTTLETGTVGLIPGLGVFNTFSESAVSHADSIFTSHRVVGSNVDPVGFTGSGLNDGVSGGAYMGTGTPTFTLEVDSATNGSITAFSQLNGAAITVMASASTGSITAMVDAGGGNTTITSNAHGLDNSDRVTITSTSAYNGTFTIAAVTANTYQIVRAFGTDEATGTWNGNTDITSAAHGLTDGNNVVITNTTNYSGTYTIKNKTTNTFEIVKEFSSDDATGRWELDPNPTSGTSTITSNAHGLSNGNTINITGTTGYNGIYAISSVNTNTFVISKSFSADDATGTWEKPNTFKWKKDSGAYTSLVAMTGSAQNLQEGVQITFNARFGHTSGDVWTIAISALVTAEIVHYGDVFNGFLYTSVEYSNGTVLHHYIDGAAPTRIADANCPNSKGVIKMEEKIWAINGNKVNFSATGNPRDWTSASDAGNLPVGLRQRGSDTALALGQYKESNLVVFFADGAQLWAIDPDPANHAFSQSLFGSQSRYHLSIFLLFQDMYFLSDYGFRSISEAVLTDSQAEIDIGTPIDSVVKADLPPAATDTPRAAFNPELGQYMCAVGTTIYVFTVSKTAKITAWAEYEMPWSVTDIAVLNSEVYIRNGDDIYRFDETVYRDGVETGKAITIFANNGSGGTTVTSTAHGRLAGDEVIISGTTNYNGVFTITGVTTNTFDIATAFVANDATGTYTAGTIFEFEMEMPFVDAKRPAELKQWIGVDTVTEGTGRITFKYDPRDESLVTDEMSLTGDTRPGSLTPIELVSASISPILKNSLNEEFRVDALSLHFEKLGNM